MTTRHDLSLPEKEVSGGVKIYRLPSHSLWKLRYPFLKKNHDFHRLTKEIRQENIDYYVSNTRFQQPAILGCLLAREAGKEAIVIEHGTGGQ